VQYPYGQQLIPLWLTTDSPMVNSLFSDGHQLTPPWLTADFFVVNSFLNHGQQMIFI